ncbi:dihydroorotate dehydrogenase [Anaeropeptidivorans aminofermentans]|uniref:dihydroorotate dehydrogenase n=1 Tax=Anaeropeptidivorans aminofermentans TaxID=2934315 RepID=UPI0020242727|nr:dihydroorotate dehydrogenase [Anaeropeptidivorans aminofermentans]
MNRNLSVTIADVTFKNPVGTASGTFGSGREFVDFIDLNNLGSVTVKGVSAEPWLGNPSPRAAETYGGMLNSVGLQNPGAYEFIKNDIPFLRQFDTKIIVNICGHTVEEYAEVAKIINEADIDMMELNISCPNVSQGGITFGTNTEMVEKVVGEIKKVITKPLIVKLSPNVTDIAEIAKSAESAGADAISLINTLLGMRIDIHKRKPVLANKMGGLSGPAIKPVAVRMVYQVRKAVQIPIIGMGGISNWEDAIEFIMAGASMISVGTANFMNPMVTEEILSGIINYMDECHIKDIKDITGIIE